MIDKVEKKSCTGCCSCIAFCPQKCIEVELDNGGFWYPVIKNSKCIGCDICESVCPAMGGVSKLYNIKSYAAYNKDKEVRLKSSSGGIFYSLAVEILRHGGVVFGAVWRDNKLCHAEVLSERELKGMCGSKYLQSYIGNTYVSAKQYLAEGKKVYFTGTPCQIAGLRRFLGKEYENLICQDIICHGVPSPKAFEVYKKDLEKRYGEIKQIIFRDKKKGWRKYAVSIEFISGKKIFVSHNYDRFMRGYLDNIYLRESCYDCQYKGIERVGDITLGDFWGIESVVPEYDDDAGVSIVLVNSEKGNDLFRCVFDKLNITEVDVADAIKYNRSAVESASRNELREGFIADIDSESVMKRFCKISPLRKFLSQFYKK